MILFVTVLEGSGKYRRPADRGIRSENAHMGCFARQRQKMYFLILLAGQIDFGHGAPSVPIPNV